MIHVEELQTQNCPSILVVSLSYRLSDFNKHDAII